MTGGAQVSTGAKRWAGRAQTSVLGYMAIITSRPGSAATKSPLKAGSWSDGLAQLELMDYQFRQKDQQAGSAQYIVPYKPLIRHC